MRTTINQTVTAAAYSSGMAVGGKITLPDLGGPRGSVITDITFIDKAAQAYVYDVLFFDSNLVGTVTDRQAFNLHDSDRAKLLCFVPLSVSCALGTGGLAIRASNIYERLTFTGRNGYAVVVARGTPTFSTVNDVMIHFTSERVFV